MKTKEDAKNIYDNMFKQLLELQINNGAINRINLRRAKKLEDFKNKDNQLFEMVAINLFSAGMKSRIVDNKWPAIKRAFYDFDVEIVSKFGDKEIDELLNNASIIRHPQKINSTIYNAKIIRKLQHVYGSFYNYLNSSKDLVSLSKDIIKRFKYIGKEVVWDFLGTIGFEAIKPDVHVRRILHRIGFISSHVESDSVYREVFDAANLLSEVSGERLRVIDALIWYYGADRPDEIKKVICAKKPLCHECYISEYCDYYNNR